jgi:hypothetical protein
VNRTPDTRIFRIRRRLSRKFSKDPNKLISRHYPIISARRLFFQNPAFRVIFRAHLHRNYTGPTAFSLPAMCPFADADAEFAPHLEKPPQRHGGSVGKIWGGTPHPNWLPILWNGDLSRHSLPSLLRVCPRRRKILHWR